MQRTEVAVRRRIHRTLMATIALMLTSGFATPDAHHAPSVRESQVLEAGRKKRLPPLPSPKQKEKWETQCIAGYVRCIDAGGGAIEGRVYGETQCRACRDACRRNRGKWPQEANGKPCPGG